MIANVTHKTDTVTEPSTSDIIQIQNKEWIIAGISRGYYTGGWLNDLPHGNGIMIYHNGVSYVGDYTNGYWQGHGILTLTDGSVFSGEFSKGYYILSRSADRRNV